jgi:hypothetical protein
MNDKKVGVLPSCWGQSAWLFIHSIAYAYNPQIDKQKYFDFFSNLGSILPCEECRIHYSQNLNKQELIIALETNENLFKWVYDLHNKVNKQIGVSESNWPSYESIKQRYTSFKASCSEIGVCGSKTQNHKKLKIVEQFGNLSEEQLPLLISTISLAIIVLMLLAYIIYNRKKWTEKK